VAEKVERLVNLTVALLEAPGGDELGRAAAAHPLLHRGFARRARDGCSSGTRTSCAALGVPIETVTLPHSDELGYTIRRRSYELPDVELTGEEVAALALAVRLTGAQDTPLALAKLAARAPDPIPIDLPGDTRVEVSPEPVDAVADAVVERTRCGSPTAAPTAPPRPAPSIPTASCSAVPPGTSSGATTPATPCGPSAWTG
jgi:proteasome accessory factor B